MALRLLLLFAMTMPLASDRSGEARALDWSFRHEGTSVMCFNSWRTTIEVRSNGSASFLAEPIIRSEGDSTCPERRELSLPPETLATAVGALSRVDLRLQPCGEPLPTARVADAGTNRGGGAGTDWREDIIFSSSSGASYEQEFTVAGMVVEVWKAGSGGGYQLRADGTPVGVRVLEDGTLVEMPSHSAEACELDELADELVDAVWELVREARERGDSGAPLPD